MGGRPRARSPSVAGTLSGELGWLHTGIGEARRGRGARAVARRHGRTLDDGARRRARDDRARRSGTASLVAEGVTAWPQRRPPLDWPRSRCPISGCPTPSRCCRRRSSPSGSNASARAMDAPRIHPPRRLGRPRAQRQPRLPQRLRPTLRGGGADRRALRRACRPRGQRVRGHGGRRAPPDAASSPSRTSACPASRATTPHRCPRSSRDEGISDDSRIGVVGWKTYATRDVIEVPAFLVDELRRATPRGLVENATDLLISPSDGLRVVNEVHQLAAFEWAACQTSAAVRRVLTGLRAGHDRTRLRSAPRVERRATLVSLHAHRRAARALGLLSPGRSADRARRSLHDRVRDLGCAQLPGRLPRRGCRRAAGRNQGLRRATRRALLRSGGRVVRRAAHRPGRGRAPAHRRPPPRRPVLRRAPEPGPPAAPRRVGQLAGVPRLPSRAALGHGAAVRHHPRHRHPVLHDEHRRRRRARR